MLNSNNSYCIPAWLVRPLVPKASKTGQPCPPATNAATMAMETHRVRISIPGFLLAEEEALTVEMTLYCTRPNTPLKTPIVSEDGNTARKKKLNKSPPKFIELCRNALPFELETGPSNLKTATATAPAFPEWKGDQYEHQDADADEDASAPSWGWATPANRFKHLLQ